VVLVRIKFLGYNLFMLAVDRDVEPGLCDYLLGKGVSPTEVDLPRRCGLRMEGSFLKLMSSLDGTSSTLHQVAATTIYSSTFYPSSPRKRSMSFFNNNLKMI
jgi:hypothetical protein